MIYLYFAFFFCVGFIFGRIRKPGGVIRIDSSNPEKDLYTLEVHIPMEDLPDRKGVYFLIETSRDKHAL